MLTLDASGTPHVVPPRTRLAKQAVGQAVFSHQGISYTDCEGNSSLLEEPEQWTGKSVRGDRGANRC
jgi:hypothetical protein